MSKNNSEGEGIFFRYWSSYGRFNALIRSPYLWISVIITLLLFPLWSNPNWWDDVLSILPNLLGFSLGGYAMWLAIGDDSFRQVITGKDHSGETSPYMDVNAAFVHFILLQVLALVLALFAKAWWNSDILIQIFGNVVLKYGGLIYYFFGFFIFIYALMSAVAATLALLQVSSWYDEMRTEERNKNE